MSDQVEISKGMAALRRNNIKSERISMGGEMFYFRKLTIDMEEALDRIVNEHQDKTLKMPERPAEDAAADVIEKFAADFIEFKQRSDKAFRKLTAEIMKYVLLDETDKPFFSPEDDVYSTLNNVYAANFFRAYNKFRNGAEAGTAEAEKRFQG